MEPSVAKQTVTFVPAIENVRNKPMNLHWSIHGDIILVSHIY